MLKQDVPLSPEVARAIDRSHTTDNVNAKKYYFLVCLALSERVRRAYKPHCPVYKFDPWIRTLRQEIDIFLQGGTGRPDSEDCSSWTQAKYPTVDVLVARLVGDYISN